LQKDKAGSGALGDLGAHVIDLAQFVTGERLTGVSATLETFVRERPLPAAVSGLSGRGDRSEGTGEVTVDDAAIVLARTSGGALATFEATRFATGRKNAMRLEVNGSLGSLAFDFEAMNELHVYDATVPATDAGFRRILVTEPDHPYTGAWWPAGHGLGYEHTFTHEVVDLVRDIAADRDPEPSFADGVAVQRILAAIEQSAASSSCWTPIPTPDH
jgi:predicted dehydrogenase